MVSPGPSTVMGRAALAAGTVTISHVDTSDQHLQFSSRTVKVKTGKRESE